MSIVSFKRLSINLIALLFLQVTTSAAQQRDPEITRTELQKLIPSDVEIETTFTANITKGSFRDILIVGRSKNPPIEMVSFASYGAIISFDKEGNIWRSIYSEYKPLAGMKILTGPILSDRDVAIIASWSGSGSFMDYIVVGYLDNKLQILLEREGLGSGEIEIQGDQIIEQESDCAVAYQWSGKSLLGTPLNIEPIPPISPLDQVVQYRVYEDGSIHIDQKEIELSVGQKLVFQRIGCNEPRCSKPWARDFICNRKILEVKSRDEIYAKKLGTDTLELYCRYAELDKGAKIIIRVLQSDKDAR